MPVKVNCPHCHKNVIADAAEAGRTVPCPACNAPVPVPAETAAPSEAKAAPAAGVAPLPADSAPAAGATGSPAATAYITFTCPNCGKPTGFPAAQHGKPATCPACRMQVLVPEASGQPSFVLGGVAPEPAAAPAGRAPAGGPAAASLAARAHANRARKQAATTPVPEGEAQPSAKPRRLWLMIAAGVLLAALIGGGVLLARRGDKSKQPVAAATPAAEAKPGAPTTPAPAPADATTGAAGTAVSASPAPAEKAASGDKTVTAKAAEKAAPSVLNNWADDFVKPAPAAPAAPTAPAAPVPATPEPAAPEPAVPEAPKPPAEAPKTASKDAFMDLLLGSRNNRNPKARTDGDDDVAAKPAEKTAEKTAKSVQPTLVAPAPEVRPQEAIREPQPQDVPKESAALGRALTEKDEAGAIQHIQALGETNASAAVTHLLKASRTASPAMFEAIRKALGALNHPTALDALLTTYKTASDQPSWALRILLLDALSNRDSAQATEAFKRAMQDQHPKVRLAAIRALARGQISVAERVPLLVAALAATEKCQDFGTPHWEARKALVTCTGYDFPKAREWQEFLNRSGKSYLEKKGTRTEPVFTEKYSYYELPVTSRRLVFLIDTSGSMREYDTSQTRYGDEPRYEQPTVRYEIPSPVYDGPWEEGERTVGTDRAGTSRRMATKSKEYQEWQKKYQEWQKGYQEWLKKHPEVEKAQREYSEKWQEWRKKHPATNMSRLERAKAELCALIEKLPADAWFNVLPFNTKVDTYKPTLVQAAPVEKTGAIAFVKRLSPNGNTATDAVLEKVFEADSQADTVYLLSDGEPSHDGIAKLPIEPILARVRDLNRYHRIIIHTLLLGREGSTFMKALAEENGGTFEDITQKAPNTNPAK